MSKREEVQQQAIDAYFQSKDGGTLLLAPRTGKCRIALRIIEESGIQKVHILYPRHDIKQGWEEEMDKMNFHPQVEYHTFRSIAKMKPDEWTTLVIDEPQELSVGQINTLVNIIASYNNRIALTGTLTKTKEWRMEKVLETPVLFRYSIEEAVRDGILANYSINIHVVPLSKAEQKKWDGIGYLKKKLEKQNKDTYFLELKQISFLQKCNSKVEKTKELIHEYFDERLLVFCGLTEVADNLGIPAYHSKKKEESLIRSFCTGETAHMSTVNLIQAGVTILPINRGVINYISGAPEQGTQKICRFLGFEYDNPDKKASIHIVCTDTEFERDRLKMALSYFDEFKINWLC